MATDSALAHAIHMLRNGEREAARSLLEQITQDEPLNADGWLWLAAATDAPAQKRMYLQQVLAINPADQRAQAGLRALDQQAGELSAAPVAISTGSSALQAEPTIQSAAEPATSKPETVAPTATPLRLEHRLSPPRFVATGVRSRRAIPWQILAIIGILVLLIPLAFFLS